MILNVTLHGKMRGYVESGTYFSVRKPQHLMRKWQAFGLSTRIIDYLNVLGVERIVFLYDGLRRHRYECRLNDFVLSDLSFVDESEGVSDLQKFVRISQMRELV